MNGSERRSSDALGERYFTDQHGPQQLLTAETADFCRPETSLLIVSALSGG
ncbi:MAG: hypothetical protein ACREQ8_00565 [Woeseiaceae bacterium]